MFATATLPMDLRVVVPSLSREDTGKTTGSVPAGTDSETTISSTQPGLALSLVSIATTAACTAAFAVALAVCAAACAAARAAFLSTPATGGVVLSVPRSAPATVVTGMVGPVKSISAIGGGGSAMLRFEPTD
jgi:hypothetical protein